jgi:alpha-tubulin suppressor-like RCC1 family protein
MESGRSATAISVGTTHVCARLNNGGRVVCWGYNRYGTVGIGTGGQTPPPHVGDDPGEMGNSLQEVLLGAGGWRVFSFLSRRICYPRVSPGIPDLFCNSVLSAAARQPISLSAGQAHTCSVLSDANVVCWGFNQYGQLGIGSTSNTITPSSMTGLINTILAPGS